MKIVGISAHYHDAASCILVDGHLVAAAQEERFTRRKHDPRLPIAAFRYCLAEANFDINEIDCIAYYEDPIKKLSRQKWTIERYSPNSQKLPDSGLPEREIRELLGYEGRIEYVNHHFSHAASAYFFSGFEEAAILVVDGVGEWASTSYGYARRKSINLFEKVCFPHSIGLLYSTITAYLGFKVNDGEYKVMGLAPYGKPRYVEHIGSLIKVKNNGQYSLVMEYFDFQNGKRMYSDKLCDLLGKPSRVPESRITQFTKDVAHSLQIVLEDMLLQKVQYLYEKVQTKSLCMAGGVALNCVANSKILKQGPFEQIFVQPAASDSGCALGAATWAHICLTGNRPIYTPMTHDFYGPSYTNKDIIKLLTPTPVNYQNYASKESKLLLEVAGRLASGQVIGWFQGRMEFGPRALGGRSILADPRRSDMRDRINAMVKKRESFRPFAPSVLLSKASEHFDLDHPSPFMLETSHVISSLELPAITHIDGSARVQTVDAVNNPRFNKLLQTFDRLTSCPILLNTSFNVRGEPIVCTPIDAILCFIHASLDCLVIEDILIDRQELPSVWIDWFKNCTPTYKNSISSEVYTFF